MQRNRKFDLTSVRLAIEKAGASPARIAAELNTTRATVYRYLKLYPELMAAFEAAKGGSVVSRKQFSRDAFMRAIHDSHGIKSAVAAAVGCSRQTVDNALKEWPELVDMLEAERGQLVARAVSALAQDISNPDSEGHQRAYLFALRTLGKNDGFAERTEVTGADGAALQFEPETMKLIAALGLDTSQLAKQFEAMIRAEAAHRGMLDES